MDDLPNGACIMYVDGERSGTSLGICGKNEDCAGELFCGNQGLCVDGNGVLESDRIVQSCVSPKGTAEDNGYMGDRWLAGCPEGYDTERMLECHRWWIGEEGMVWKRYLHFNDYGYGDAYAWAYDEAVCATSQATPPDHWFPPSGPFCTTQNPDLSAVDSSGNVIDNTCPCTVNNRIDPLVAQGFSAPGFGYGVNMHLHVYDLLYPGHPYDPAHVIEPVEIGVLDSEKGKFYVKVVNQYKSDILVYMDGPPGRKGEKQSSRWTGWTGPVSTMRGKMSYVTGEPDPWVDRIKIVSNTNPNDVQQPIARGNSEFVVQGGFYVPKGYHLRVLISDESEASGGWFSCSNPDACDTLGADKGDGKSFWVTHADAYTYPDRNPLLLLEPNFNTANGGDFKTSTIWFNLSAVDGVNANVLLRYGIGTDPIRREMSTPLFESRV